MEFQIKTEENINKTIEDTIPDIISGNMKLMITVSEIIGNHLGLELPKKERLYIHQIRKIFGMIKKIQMESFSREKLQLLKPQIVFMSVKNDSTLGLQYLRDILIKSIDTVEDNENKFLNFIAFFEAILAYHQAAEKS